MKVHWSIGAVIVMVATWAASVGAATTAYWRFEGNNGVSVADGTGVPLSGTPIRDEVGSNHGLGVNGLSTTWEDDVFGSSVPDPDASDTSANGTLNANGANTRSLHFTSDSEYVSVADDPALNFSGAFTVEGFFRTTETNTLRALVGKRLSSGSFDGYRVYLDADGYLQFLVDGTDNGRVGYDDVRVDDDQWHHFAAIRDASDDLHIWVDGVKDTTPDTGGSGNASGTISNSLSLLIGEGRTVGSYHFAGYIDEIRLSDTALTQAEFLNLPTDADTIAYWRFEGNAGATVADGTAVPSSGTPIRDELGRNHGVASGGTSTTWQGADTGDIPTAVLRNPDAVDTRLNGTLNANGSNVRSLLLTSASDHIVVSDSASLNFDDGPFTIEGYFRAADAASIRVIVEKRLTGSPFTGYRLYLDTNGHLQFFADAGADDGRVGYNDAELDDGQWHHFAAIRDSSDDLHIWVDWQEDTTPDVGNGGDASGSVSNTASLLIGNSSAGYDFPGFIDEIRFSAVALEKEDFLFTLPRGTTVIVR